MGSERTRDHGIRETGLFWRALRAPEFEIASKAFDGVFTRNAQGTGFFYAMLLFGPWMFVAGVMLSVVGSLMAGLDAHGSSASEFLAGAAFGYLVYIAFSAFFSLVLFVHFNPRFRLLRAPKPEDPNALTDRTAMRLANVYFARFLRRLVFPWEWYFGRP